VDGRERITCSANDRIHVDDAVEEIWMELAKMVALVTGASSGIGRLLALSLAEKGARVALVARRADLLCELPAEIRRRGGDSLAVPCDVADPAQVQAASTRVLEHYGAVDLLVNNAGYGHHRSFLEWELADIERMMRVNYFGAVYFTRALLPQMVARRSGWIVFVASVAGKIAVPDESAYVATKFALVGFAEAVSLELEDQGVHVLTVCPGAIRTPFFDDEALDRLPPAARRTMVEPERLVEAILKALARGKREITHPRFMALAYVVRAMAPGFFRRQVRRQTIDAFNKKRAPGRGLPRSS